MALPVFRISDRGRVPREGHTPLPPPSAQSGPRLEVEDNRGPADGAGCVSQSSVGFEAGPDSISDAGCVETVPTVHQLHPCFCHVAITWRLQQLVQLFLSTPAGRLKANDAGVPVWCRPFRDIRRLYLLFCRRHSRVLDASEPLRTLRALARRLHLGLESSHGSLEVPGQDGLDDVLLLRLDVQYLVELLDDVPHMVRGLEIHNAPMIRKLAAEPQHAKDEVGVLARLVGILPVVQDTLGLQPGIFCVGGDRLLQQLQVQLEASKALILELFQNKALWGGKTGQHRQVHGMQLLKEASTLIHGHLTPAQGELRVWRVLGHLLLRMVDDCNQVQVVRRLVGEYCGAVYIEATALAPLLLQFCDNVLHLLFCNHCCSLWTLLPI
mmetsp:Transcript_15471/g.36587  ORF Transcript_15471/g.36587 Transcript_15471/m.36587 type:complete len:382 (-) Transcript_15471:201-1346(-)